jgi:diguanylate cyclase (GGDEF)-like protein
VLVDIGLAGERIVARVRLTLVGLLFLVPLRSTLVAPGARENHVGLAVAAVTLGLAVVMYVMANQGVYRRWFGFATGVLDVTLVSLALASYLTLGEPHTAVNSKVVFEAYFLAIGATCLRYDRRICWAAGLAALVQYGAIVLYADQHWALNDAAFAPFAYGMFSWSAQGSRLILLLCCTVLASAIVGRAEELRRLSSIDALTGLPNRGYFDQRLTEEMERARELARPLAVALVDVDRFKQFNDGFGHAAGDAALQTIAQAMRAHGGSSAIVSRYGGEEFAILLPDTTLETAILRLDRLRRGVAETIVPLTHHTGSHRLTVSVGVAAWPVDGWEADEVVHRADIRLFASKRDGRNRVTGADDMAPPEPASPSLMARARA